MVKAWRNNGRSVVAAVLAVIVLSGSSVLAILPEPDKVLYGTITVNGRAVTAVDTQYLVEARATLGGPVLESYRMGANTNYHPYFYGLRLTLEALPPNTGRDLALGDTVYLTLRNGAGPVTEVDRAVLQRGLSRVDFGAVADTDRDDLPDLDEFDTHGTNPLDADTDGDGMSDGWEVANNLNPLLDDADVDSDHDGYSNLAEFRKQTDPWDPNDWPPAYHNDFDGDALTDFGVYHPPTGDWYLLTSSNGYDSFQFGWYGPRPVPADYDGDGITDPAVYDRTEGRYYIMQSQDGFRTLLCGTNGNPVPVPADYDGDRKADPAAYDQNSGWWTIESSLLGPLTRQFGWREAVPVPRDYDGDHITDLAVYHYEGYWYLLMSQDGFEVRQFGWNGGAVPMPEDYDRDGLADLALFHGPTGMWYILRSRAGFLSRQFGWDGPIPVRGDWDGDGMADIALYDMPNGAWYILRSSEGFLFRQFGWWAAMPLP